MKYLNSFSTQDVPQLSFHLVLVFSQLPVLVQRIILLLFDSPGDEFSKTHLTFLPTSKNDQVHIDKW